MCMQFFENEVGSGVREGCQGCQLGCQVNLHIIVGLGGMQALDSPTKTYSRYTICAKIFPHIQGYRQEAP